MDVEFTKMLATLGIGGILAGFMFFFYRKDSKEFAELWNRMADQLITVVKENTISNTKVVESNNRIIGLLETIERNAMRRQDIEQMIDARLDKKSKES